MSGTRSQEYGRAHPKLFNQGAVRIDESDGNELDSRILDSKANSTFGWNASGLPVCRDDDWYTFTSEITTQGNTGTPSVVTITRNDADGAAATGTAYLRVRVCNSGAYATAATATIAAGTGTTSVETMTTNKDLVLQSTASGTWLVQVTDGTAETVTLRIGAATMTPMRADYSLTQNVTHAAP